MSTTAKPTPNKPSRKARRSWNSVSVTYVDTEAIRRNLQRAVQALVRDHPEIERILLFGSFATGQAVPGSDLDLLVVLSDTNRRFLDRIPLYTPGGCGVGVDVFPYTRAEIQTMLAAGNFFITRALAEGVPIYPPAEPTSAACDAPACNA